MAALDTNVLVRIITRDHAEQTAKAKDLVRSHEEEGLYISPVVLAEVTWVLERAYKWRFEEIHQALHITAHCGSFRLDDTCHSAIELYKRDGPKGIGFADCLILQTVKDKHQGPLFTFDQKLGSLPSAKLL